MKEYMLLIRNQGDAKKSLSDKQHLAFIKKCEEYIAVLKKEKQLIAAQPLLREGMNIFKDGDLWIEKKLVTDAEVQVGYYHILANSMDEAIRIAKENPEFEYVASASIEVRPVKSKETETGFVYPKNR